LTASTSTGKPRCPQIPKCLSEGKDALDPAVTFFACYAEAQLSSLNREANHALCVIVRRRDPGFPQEYPQRIHFSLKTLCERAGSAFAPMVKRDKMQQPGVEHIPLDHGWRRGSHPTQTQQFFLSPYATSAAGKKCSRKAPASLGRPRTYLQKASCGLASVVMDNIYLSRRAAASSCAPSVISRSAAARLCVHAVFISLEM